ncbi:MAG: PAS domain S-box protein [Nitrospira sp.]|nr:PAS domain S-box protein [Nitrospira sp.]
MKRVTLNLQAPYVGLRPFGERDAVLFFGREQHVQDLLDKLEGRQRFIAVLGASGTGKSSLVRAGLVPALHRGALTAAGHNWNVCIFKPGDAPLTNLAQALTEHPWWRDSEDRSDAVASLSASLARSPLALTELYRQKAQAMDGQALLLIVDQFEEIFRYRQKNVDEAESFINLLLRSASEDVPIYVVMTMRSDFLGNCVTFFGLPEAINHGIYLTPRLGPDQLKSIIASPLALVGGDIDPLLVSKLVNSLGGEDELPIMEHALLRMWNRARNNGRPTIEREDFETVCASREELVGQARLGYAIDNHASEIYCTLSAHQQIIARQLFLALVTRREERVVRRSQMLKQLVELVGEQERENLLFVIKAFRAQEAGFLFPQISTSLKDDNMIDISHESLFRQWDLFRWWLDEEGKDVEELREWQKRAVTQQEGGGWLDEYDCERAQRWLARIEERVSPAQWATRYGGLVSYRKIKQYIEESNKRVTLAKAKREGVWAHVAKAAVVRYEWVTFVMVLLTLVTLGVGTFMLGRVERSIVAAVWLPLLVLLLWSSSRLRAEYRQAQQESAWARAAEAALLQSQERNRAIVDTALDGVITIDAAGIVTEWNAQASAIFGWAREEAIGSLLSETIIPERDREAHASGIHEYLKTGVGPVLNRRIEIAARHRDGHEFPVEIAVSPARIGETYIFSAFVRDITDRRRAERRLASQYAVTRVLSESITLEQAVPRIIQAVGESLEWDLGVFWRLERQSGTLHCLNYWQALPGVTDGFITEMQSRVFKPGVGLPGRILESGSPVWIRDVALDPTFDRADLAAKTGVRSAFGFPIRIGRDIEGVIEFFSHQIRESDNELISIITDVGLKIGQFGERTREQTRTEEALRQTEAQLRQSQKMEAVGRLAGGVAHDFNNLLTVIRGYSELILGRLAPGDPVRREMDEVKKATDRAVGLTSQLLTFSRRQFVAAKVLDLNALVMNMDGLLRRLLGEDVVELSADLDPKLWAIKADPGQIEQVIMNLAMNARDAMPTGGKLTIQTKNVTIGKGGRRQTVMVEPGAYVLLEVKDTGHGMSEDTQAHLFEPFFTTKEKGKGTGLGLSTVYGVVKQSGGTITIESKKGQGTVCKIFFPKTNEIVESKQVVGETVRGAVGKERP